MERTTLQKINTCTYYILLSYWYCWLAADRYSLITVWLLCKYRFVGINELHLREVILSSKQYETCAEFQICHARGSLSHLFWRTLMVGSQIICFIYAQIFRVKGQSVLGPCMLSESDFVLTPAVLAFTVSTIDAKADPYPDAGS